MKRGGQFLKPWAEHPHKRHKTPKKRSESCGVCGVEIENKLEAGWDVNGYLCAECFKARYGSE